ncbi:MAG: histidinol-phosphate transaminase [Bacteroidota bacterium]
MMISRRSWMQTLTTAGAGSLLLSPREVLRHLDQPTDEKLLDTSLVRLSSNENPYSPSQAMVEAMSQMQAKICRYPNADFASLEEIIAEREGVPASQVVVTSGSREGLKAVGLMKAIQGGEIGCCLPTYRALLTYAEMWGADLRVSPLTEDLQYNLAAIEEAISDKTSMVFVCNPNNPTGRLLPADELKAFCQRASQRTTVFVDEVYFDYIETSGYPSMKSLIADDRDVIISRTLSKVYGLAGARIGYLMANNETAATIRNTLMSGTNVLGIALGKAAFGDEEFKSFSLQKNRECKQLIYSTLSSLQLDYLESHTNFVFFKTDRPITEVQQAFKSSSVQVGRAFPPYMDWCRISTGKVEEVQEFCRAAREVFG